MATSSSTDKIPTSFCKCEDACYYTNKGKNTNFDKFVDCQDTCSGII